MNLRRSVLPAIVLAAFSTVAYWITSTTPDSGRRHASKKPALTVEVMEVRPQTYPIEIRSFGTIQPQIQSRLTSQVSGFIKEVSVNYREGGFFEKGEVLLTIDDRDYLSELRIVEAELANAKLALVEEQTRAEQAAKDWRNIGSKAKATEFALRKPQVIAAEAAVDAAQAKLAKAKLNLERTKVRAPFAGRILRKSVDLGQVVSANTQLAEIYSIDSVEVRLPIKNSELAYLDLPESYRFSETASWNYPKVTIVNQLGNTPQTWEGRIVRTAGAIDENSNQLYIIAQIDDPYGLAAESKRPLKIGQYVSARIQGTAVENALVIPNYSVYQNSYIFVVEDGKLQRREIDIRWQNATEALVSEGVFPGDRVVLTTLGQVGSGTLVQIKGEASTTQIADQKPDNSTNKKGEQL